MPQMPPQNKEINKNEIKLLWMQLGASETARRTGIKVNTVTKWASRYKWHKDKLPGVIGRQRTLGKPGGPGLRVAELSHDAAAGAVTVADAVLDAGDIASSALKAAHEALNGRTRTALAQAAAAAAEQVAAGGMLPVKSASEFKNLTQAASRVFGWQEQAQTSNTYNTLVITREQLQEMRALCNEA